MSYEVESIKVLKGLEAVRIRPGMFIGDTGTKGLHHLVWEILDNSVDEAMAGYCTEINVTIDPNGETISVEDNGRGIPTGMHPTENKSALEIVFTVLHAGGKFDNSGYEAAGGLHGVGASCVNALSDNLLAEVWRDGHFYTQAYERGIPKYTVRKEREIGRGEKKAGTRVTFHPDIQIFKQGIKYNEETIIKRLREISFLNKGLKITFHNKATNRKEELLAVGGIADYVKYLTEARTKPYPAEPIYAETKTSLVVREGTVQVQVALNYTEEDDETILSFANNINTIDGGTHAIGFRTAITRVVNQFARSTGLLKDSKPNLSGDDVREGLTAIVSVRLPQPEFVGQTKAKLGTVEIEGIVSTVVSEMLTTFFDKTPAVVKRIIERAMIAQEAREAAKKSASLIKRKSFLGMNHRLPGKLSDCNSNKREVCELFIVEGNSAAGCFSGDTRIVLADGRILNFIELEKEEKSGIQNFCYTIMNDRIAIQPIKNVRKTKISKLVEVVLDNGERIRCTPDHKFMLRDGSYMASSDLLGKSLMPLGISYTSKGDKGITIYGYERVFDPKSGRQIFTHCLADEWNIRNGVYTEMSGPVRHHIDFNKRNNNPINISRMLKDEHLKLHRDLLPLTLHSAESKEKSKAAKRTDVYRKFMSTLIKNNADASGKLSKRNIEQWNDKVYREKMKQSWLAYYHSSSEYRESVLIRLKSSQEQYWSVPENREKASDRQKILMSDCKRKDKLKDKAILQWQDQSLRNWRSEKTKEQLSNPAQMAKRLETMNANYFHSRRESLYDFVSSGCPTARSAEYQRLNRFAHKFFDGNMEAASRAIKSNHKVVSVDIVDGNHDVYDLEVPESHNFALASGVFVHNSAKDGRDPETQAILPIRGKIINVEKGDVSSILKNTEIQSLIQAIGTNFKDSFDIDGRRYDKIIIMADADDDGCHIATLLMTFFYRYMRQLVADGHIYLAQPPLFKVEDGKKKNYCFTGEEMNAKVAEIGEKAKVVRYKGLGEMDAEELAETTMNKSNRRLIQLQIADPGETERLTSILMGGNAQARKDHIISQVNSVVHQ